MIQSVLFLSHTERGGVFRVGSSHLSHAMDSFGIKVVHMSTPLSQFHRMARRGTARRRELAKAGIGSFGTDGVLDFVPATLFPSPFFSTASIIKKLEGIGFQECDAVFIDDPRLYHRAWKNFAETVVYRPTDFNLRKIPHLMEKMLVQECDGVAATSLPVSQALKPFADVPHTVISNGVDFSHFSRFIDRDGRSGAVFVGALDERFSWSDLIHIANSIPTLSIDLFGPLPRTIPANLPDRIRLLGPADYNELPELLSKYKFGLLPLSDSPLNAGRSPMKLYEYISAGLAVVATLTASLQSYKTLPNVSLYRDVREAVNSINSWDEKSINLEDSINAGQSESWESKTRSLLRFTESLQ